jgi:hypothetical protein
VKVTNSRFKRTRFPERVRTITLRRELIRLLCQAPYLPRDQRRPRRLRGIPTRTRRRGDSIPQLGSENVICRLSCPERFCFVLQSPTRLARWESQSLGFRRFGQKFVQEAASSRRHPRRISRPGRRRSRSCTLREKQIHKESLTYTPTANNLILRMNR